MKKLSLQLLLPLLALPSILQAGSGPGPWSAGAYYPGQLDGKYMGVVTGNNISGVLGFAIVDGAPPFRVQDQQSTSGGDFAPIAIVNQQISPDVLQNYFAIFVEGRTYTGITLAGIDIESNKVAGTLQGQNPVGLLPAGDDGQINFNATDALSIVDRGLSGGFTAKIKDKKALFTFRGDGQLSTPANPQVYSLQTEITPPPIAIGDPATNMVVTGSYTTESTPFQISGIRTSFLASNPAAQSDQLGSQGAAAGGE